MTPFIWSTRRLRVELALGLDEPARITRITATEAQVGAEPAAEAPLDRKPVAEAQVGWGSQALVEILATGHGRARAAMSYTHTAIGERLRPVSHEVTERDGWSILTVIQRDPVTGLVVTTTLRAADGVTGFQAWTTVTNASQSPVRLEAVSSCCVGLRPRNPAGVGGLRLSSARSTWVAENRWTTADLRSLGAPDIDTQAHGQAPRGRVARTGASTWSTGEHFPIGVLADGDDRLAWQVEHDGPWHWEVVDGGDDASLGLFGPTDDQHQWSVDLAPGDTFTTVPASVVVAHGVDDAAFAAMTDQRRALRGNAGGSPLPVVFNDYMNTLMADPTTAKLLPLIDAAAAVGAEYFCIDAGWYDDDGDWWDSVGEWMPSSTRFDGGLGHVVDHIRGAGMVPGLWLEPEVVGVRSATAARLPDEAFFRRGAHRVVEHGRHQLDLSHPAARKHLDEVVDRLVDDLGIGYLKLDYNITPGLGTDGADSPGAGLLAHNRAYLDWLDGVRERHPGLVVENCASGAMRADYALLSRLDLQSTSDQQNPLRYPPIAAAAPAWILPEQAANWVYPQPGMSDEEIVLTVCTGLAGRPYLSGRADLLDEHQRALVRAGVEVHRQMRADLARSHAVWPLGLPGWDDPWVCVGLTGADVLHLVVWHRAGAPDATRLPLPTLRGRDLDVAVAYPPQSSGWSASWAGAAGELEISSDVDEPSARVFRLTVRH